MKKPHKYSKQDNPKAKKLQLQKEWEEMLKRHSHPLEKGAKAYGCSPVKQTNKQTSVLQVNSRKIKDSFGGMQGVAAKQEPKQYTGSNMLGIATSRKSNLIPVFSSDHAVDLAHMRR